jgi:hypothetical protein
MAKAGGNKDSAMAGHLVKQGYPHGRRKSATHAPTSPSMQDVGSAAYRRRKADKR